MHWIDYLVLFGMVAMSVAIGIYHSLTGDKQSTVNTYLLGNRRMPLLPVMISGTVTYVSTVTLVGMPSEVYAFGFQYYVAIMGSVLATVTAAFVFIPVFYPMKLVSVNEYILKRFGSRNVMYVGSVLSLATISLYMGSVLYGPAVAIEAATGFNSWASIVICSSVTIVYTALGGFKAVVWVDVFQSSILMIGLIIIFAQGLITIGSFDAMLDINRQWGRLETFNFDPDPTQRLNFYAALIGNFLTFLHIYGYQQHGVQRYVSLPTQKKAILCLVGMAPLTLILKTLSCAVGLVIFAYYAGYIGCDPKLDGSIRNYNLILPYFVVDLFENVPGFVGLFLATCFAASLSTLSSGLNGVSAIMWKDLISHQMPDASEMKATLINKAIAVVMGLLAMLIAFIYNSIRGTIVQILQIVGSATRGPLGVIFYVGLFLPFVNNYGIYAGSSCGLAYGIWLAAGAFVTDKNWSELPFNTANCTGINVTSMGTTALATTHSMTGLQKMYSVSWMLHTEMSGLVAVVTAVIVSLATGYRRLNTVEGRYLHPIARRVYGAKNFKSEDPIDMDKVFQVPVATVSAEVEKEKAENTEKAEIPEESHVTT